MEFRGKKYERGSNWSDSEVVELLLLWANDSVQMELESCLRNQHVFNRIAEVLREKGIYRTGDQCREKIKKMKLEYRRHKDNNKTLRGGRNWKFFDVMDRVLTNRHTRAYSTLSNSGVPQQVFHGSVGESFQHHFTPALPYGHTQPPELMEIKCEEFESDEACLTPEPTLSMAYQQVSTEEQEIEERTILGVEQNESIASGEDLPIETSISPSGFSEPNVASSTGPQNSGARPGFATFHHLRKNRKGQRSRNPLDELLLKTLSSQRSLEEGLLQLEERRLQREIQMEEQRMQLEQRRFEQDREHEYRMFNVFAQMLTILKRGSGPSTPPATSPVGQGLVQLFSDMANSGMGGIIPQEARVASSAAAPMPTPSTQDNSNLYNSSQYQDSPFLSARGNLISGFRGSSEEGYHAYHKDKYDEDKNPNGIINFGTSENKLCFDLMSKRVCLKNELTTSSRILRLCDSTHTS